MILGRKEVQNSVYDRRWTTKTSEVCFWKQARRTVRGGGGEGFLFLCVYC